MKILYNATLYNSTSKNGLNRWVEDLLYLFASTQNKDHQFYFLANGLSLDHCSSSQIIESCKNINNLSSWSHLKRQLYLQYKLSRLVKKHSIDVIFSPVTEGSFFPSCKQVITLMDLLPMRYKHLYPKWHYYYKYVVPKLIQVSELVIVPTQFIKDELEHYYGEVRPKVEVVHLSYNKNNFYRRSQTEIEHIKEKYELDEFFLSVGVVREYKNVKRLIDVFGESPELKNSKLVVVGSSIETEIGNYENIKVLKNISDDELAILYSAAKAFIFPSLYEGFGLPLLEAMACGCPLLVSNIAPFKEICEDIAVYFEAENNDSIVHSITQLVSNPEQLNKMSENGAKRVLNYSYENLYKNLIRLFV